LIARTRRGPTEPAAQKGGRASLTPTVIARIVTTQGNMATGMCTAKGLAALYMRDSSLYQTYEPGAPGPAATPCKIYRLHVPQRNAHRAAGSWQSAPSCNYGEGQCVIQNASVKTPGSCLIAGPCPQPHLGEVDAELTHRVVVHAYVARKILSIRPNSYRKYGAEHTRDG
jgi:hypothetical protein